MCPALLSKFSSKELRGASLIHPVCLGLPEPRQRKQEVHQLIWLLVLLLLVVAIGGGIAISKFLFILLVLAVIVALLGARSTG